MPLDQKRASDKNDLPLMAMDEGIVLFHPHMPAKGPEYVAHTLGTRWIGQGPKVDAFEREFRARMRQAGPCLAVGSGTDALHLAYLLAGIGLHVVLDELLGLHGAAQVALHLARRH